MWQVAKHRVRDSGKIQPTDVGVDPKSPKFKQMNLFELTKSLMTIPSTSGDEAEVGFFFVITWKALAGLWNCNRFPKIRAT